MFQIFWGKKSIIFQILTYHSFHLKNFKSTINSLIFAYLYRRNVRTWLSFKHNLRLNNIPHELLEKNPSYLLSQDPIIDMNIVLGRFFKNSSLSLSPLIFCQFSGMRKVFKFQMNSCFTVTRSIVGTVHADRVKTCQTKRDHQAIKDSD